MKLVFICLSFIGFSSSAFARAGASASSPRICAQSIKDNTAAMVNIVSQIRVNGQPDNNLISFVKTANPAKKALVKPDSIKALQAQSRTFSNFARACRAPCNAQSNQALKAVCSEVAGLAGLGMMGVVPFIEANSGFNGLKARIEKAATQQDSELEPQNRGPIFEETNTAS